MNGYIDIGAVAENAIELFGEEKQCTQAMEELNELAVAINHYKRGKITYDQLVSEFGDVKFLMLQIKTMFRISLADETKAMIESAEKCEKYMQKFQKCEGCGKVFNIYDEGSTDKPELCDDCWSQQEKGALKCLESRTKKL